MISQNNSQQTGQLQQIGQTRVGMSVLIFKEGKILLGRRKNAHGAGEYATPGGHLEYMESFEQCAIRETLEECGITLKNIRFHMLANVISYAPKHYVHIGVIADWASGEPHVLEPDKCESWGWYDLDDLPQPLFATIVLAIESYRTGRMYFDQ